jgi:hypothetical protein
VTLSGNICNTTTRTQGTYAILPHDKIELEAEFEAMNARKRARSISSSSQTIMNYYNIFIDYCYKNIKDYSKLAINSMIGDLNVI